MVRLGQKNEFLGTIASPAGGNCDPILLVNGVPKFSGIEAFGLGISVHLSCGVITHFTPLDPTFNHLRGRRSIKIFTSFSCPEIRISAGPGVAPGLGNRRREDYMPTPLYFAVWVGRAAPVRAEFMRSHVLAPFSEHDLAPHPPDFKLLKP